MDADDGRGEEEEVFFFFFFEWRATNKLNSSLFFPSFSLSNSPKQSNVPALNDLLAPFGVAFGDAVLEGPVGGVFVGEDLPPPGAAGNNKNGKSYNYASGANIARFPAGGTLFEARLAQRASEGVAATPVDGGKDSREAPDGEGGRVGRHAILGLVRSGAGAVAAYGDSGCLDSSHQQGDCFWLLDRILEFAIGDVRDPALFGSSAEEAESGSLKSAFALQMAGGGNGGNCPLPSRPLGLPAEEALPFSSVKDRNAPPPACDPNSPLQFAGPHWPPLAKEKKRKKDAEVVGAAGGGAGAAAASSTANAKPSREDLLPPKDDPYAAAAMLQKDAGSGSSEGDDPAAAVPLTASTTNSSGRNGKSHLSSSSASSTSSTSSSSTRPRSPPTSTSSSYSSTSYPAASYYSSAALNAKHLVKSAGSRAAAAGSHSSSPVALAGVGAAAALLVWAVIGAAKRWRRAAAAPASAGGADNSNNGKQRYSRVGTAPVSSSTPSSLADYGVELGNALRRPGALTSSNSRSAAHLKE